ncbi:SCAN [Lepeophtheirus salmonis]|uniref:SCAN n=1 Tax=Lepeophtheirus salmonis TaxID=72036 RepID=A0A7R8CJ87_LEPSM|nr:SCAN [Lepeophtheirus salmonis]CAF2839839.1 SCAN [Lepeophtheirus salmonis]
MKLNTLECPKEWGSLKQHLRSYGGKSLHTFRAHKLILSSGSEYLKSLISEEGDEINIQVDNSKIPGSLWKRILGYLYDGIMTYTMEEFPRILKASNELEIDIPDPSVVWKCLNCKEGFSDTDLFVSHSKVFHGEDTLFVKCGNLLTLIIEDWNSFSEHDDCSKKTAPSLPEIKKEEPWTNEDLLFIPEMSLQEGDIHEDPLAFPNKNQDSIKRHVFKKKSKTATKQLANRVQKPRNGTGPNVNSKIFLCSICGRTLTGLTAYNRHQVIHTGARPFSCNTCGKTFTQNQRLTVHKRTHTGERPPYMCSLCGKTFTESCKLKRHATRVHKANKDGSTLVGFVPKNGDSSDKIPSPDPLIDKWNNMNKNPLQQPHAPPPSMIQDAINYCSIIKEEFADKSPDRHSIKIGD